MEAIKLLVTLAGVAAPDIVIMNAMGWTSLSHFTLLGAWAVVSTAFIVLLTGRHRRADLRRLLIVGCLIGCVATGALVLGTAWDIRAIVAALLVLPGLTYLLLEGMGLTPKPTTDGPTLV